METPMITMDAHQPVLYNLVMSAVYVMVGLHLGMLAILHAHQFVVMDWSEEINNAMMAIFLITMDVLQYVKTSHVKSVVCVVDGLLHG